MLRYSLSLTLGVCQTRICVTALVSLGSSLLFSYLTPFINRSRFLGLRRGRVKACHAPCAENTGTFLPKNAVSYFLLGKIPLSNLVHFSPLTSSIKGDITAA